jgi:aryl-alcohol dehydrogenase-like predicted oxidoreductase
MDFARPSIRTSPVAIGLGTVQLGLPYGNNAGGDLMPESIAVDILNEAARAGIQFFDTASAYGESEARIGASRILSRYSNVAVSTKIPVVAKEIWSSETAYWKFLSETVAISCQKLQVPSLGLLQFHQCSLDFLESSVVQNSMKRLIEQGLCRTVGVSVYEPSQAYACLDIPSVSALQIPVNMVDLRFLDPTLILRIKSRGLQLIARSILLQGVLVETALLPPVRKREHLETLRASLLSALGPGQSLKALALQFVFINIGHIFSIALIGVDSRSALLQNLELIDSLEQPVPPEILARFEEARAYAVQNELLTPATWN